MHSVLIIITTHIDPYCIIICATILEDNMKWELRTGYRLVAFSSCLGRLNVIASSLHNPTFEAKYKLLASKRTHGITSLNSYPVHLSSKIVACIWKYGSSGINCKGSIMLCRY